MGVIEQIDKWRMTFANERYRRKDEKLRERVQIALLYCENQLATI